MHECYQCENKVEWLAPDSRCGACTRWTPEEILGEDEEYEALRLEIEQLKTELEIDDDDVV